VTTFCNTVQVRPCHKSATSYLAFLYIIIQGVSFILFPSTEVSPLGNSASAGTLLDSRRDRKDNERDAHYFTYFPASSALLEFLIFTFLLITSIISYCSTLSFIFFLSLRIHILSIFFSLSAYPRHRISSFSGIAYQH